MSDAVKQFFQSPLKTFCLLASFFGVLTIFVVAPLSGADEEAHFIRAYGISNGQLTIKQHELVSVPTSFRETLGCYQHKTVTPGEIYTYSYTSYTKQKDVSLSCAMNLPLNDTQREGLRSTAFNYSPMTYIPQVLMVYIGKLFDAPILVISYLMRLAVLVAYVAMIAFAIKLLPRRKWALVGVALLPHSIMQVTNPGGDYFLLGTIAIFVAAIFRSCEAYKKGDPWTLARLQWIALASGFLMLLPKGMFPGIVFLPMLFLFGGLRGHIIKKTVAFIVLALVASQLSNASNDYAGVSPLNFPGSFLITMFEEWKNYDFLFQTLNLGRGNPVGMPAVAITIMAFVTAMYFFVDYGKTRAQDTTNIIKKIPYLGIWTWVLVLAAIGGSFLGIYMTAPGMHGVNGDIGGVQARYFYPAFLLAASAPFTRYFVTKTHYFSTVVIYASIFLLSVQTLAVAIRYFA